MLTVKTKAVVMRGTDLKNGFVKRKRAVRGESNVTGGTSHKSEKERRRNMLIGTKKEKVKARKEKKKEKIGEKGKK